MTLMSALLLLLSSFSCLRRPRHHRRARFRCREHYIADAAHHWVLIITEPLLPLITCCLLGAGFSAAVAVEQFPGPREARLDQNGTLVNASSTRQRPFLLYESQSSHAFMEYSAAAHSAAHSAAAAASSHSSSSFSAPVSPPGSMCQLLTTTNVDQLCADLVARRLDSLSSPRAERRLQFCDMFDYRKLLVFASSLTNGSVNCSTLLIEEGRPNKTTCILCLMALSEKDEEARAGVDDHRSVLAKVQCNSLSSSSNFPHSSHPPDLITSSPYGVSPSTSSSSSLSSSADNEAEEEADTLTTVPMTPQTHAGSSNCSACQRVYKDWLCSAIFDDVRPFATQKHLSWKNRLHKVPACDSWCAAVETECPYFTPDEEQQNGGEPLFLCTERHYHDSSRYPYSTGSCRSDSHRHKCCYTLDDLNFPVTNSTCASLENVCISETPVNASSPSSITQQQQQYSGVLEANVTTNITLASSGGRTGDYGAISRLLLLLLVAYCCSELT